MADALVVRLLGPAAGPEAEWIVMDARGGRLGGVSRGTLAEAAANRGDHRVLGLVPGTDITLARPELPVRSGPRVAQAVPFALEEQLAGDVEDMHFAVGRRDERPGVPVAGVARDRMQAWQSQFAAAGLDLDGLYAETSAVPVIPGGVTLLVDRGQLFVRRADELPVVLDVQPLAEAIQLALATSEETRENVTVYLSQAEYDRERDLIEGLREVTASLQVKLLPDGALPLLASTALQDAAVNLLQGPYAPKRQFSVSLAPWRYAAMLAAAFFVVHLGVKGVEYWRLAREEARIDAEIAQVFETAMPGVRQVEPRQQMQQRYFAMRGGGGGSGLLANLDPLGAAIAETPQARLEALAYRNRVLDLRMLAPDVNALEKIRTRIAERGLNAEIQSASPREDNSTEGRLQIRAPGA
ncbi:MAG TPA: type II secretion system protein GspL [Steroidobacteraceae bacterium]|nr:type II secretion system protein GspL [Steroidobacteraceae bacterium]